jgi:5-methylcytosine-specific restriction enzyme A
MTAVLLRWNPDHGDDWQPSYREAIDQVAETGVFRRAWGTGLTSGNVEGSEAWLVLENRKGHGLLGHGAVISGRLPVRPARGSEEYSTYFLVQFDALVQRGDQVPLDAAFLFPSGSRQTAAALDAWEVPAAHEHALRETWSDYREPDGMDPVLPAPGTLPETALARVGVNRYERDPYARRICLAHHGTSCAVCGFSFEATYGSEGRGFIHTHHLVPASQLGGQYELDPIRDLVPLCPNCHLMAHRRPVPYTPAELRRMMSSAGFLSGTLISDEQLTAQAEAERILGS